MVSILHSNIRLDKNHNLWDQTAIMVFQQMHLGKIFNVPLKISLARALQFLYQPQGASLLHFWGAHIQFLSVLTASGDIGILSTREPTFVRNEGKKKSSL